MAAKRDYYEVLGVNRDADDGAIKKAYRKLAKKYHPDTNAGNKTAEERFKEASEAYAVLSDKEKRKMYDQFGHAAFDGTAGAGSGAGPQGGFHGGPFQGSPFGGGSFTGSYGDGGNYQEFHFEGGDMDDILKNLFGGGFSGHGASGHAAGGSGSGSSRGHFQNGSFGGDFGGSNFAGSGFSGKGSDLNSDISVTFDEAAFGCEKIISFSSTDGSQSRNSLKVKIPAGIDNGQTIRLAGKGMPAHGNGQPGDLLLKVNVGTRPGFKREGTDVYTSVSIPFITAALGGNATVETLDGKVLCTIKPGTQSQTKIRLKGKGIVSMKNPSVKGDLYVSVQIQVPKDLSDEAKRKLKEFEAACIGTSGSSSSGAGQRGAA